MMDKFYLCPKCFEAADDPTPCPRCGGKRAACQPGAADNPVRKPLMAATGELKSRAPVWWLQAVGTLFPGAGVAGIHNVATVAEAQV